VREIKGEGTKRREKTNKKELGKCLMRWWDWGGGGRNIARMRSQGLVRVYEARKDAGKEGEKKREIRRMLSVSNVG
jgi:hypothetical protein